MVASSIKNGVAGDSPDNRSKGGDVFRCPSDPAPRPSGWKPRSYSWNRASGRGVDGGIALAAIPAPADTLHIVERPAEYNVTNWAWGCLIDTPNQQTTGIGSVVGKYPPAHAGGWNYLFCDSHVKWLRPERTIETGTMDRPNGMWTVAEGD